MDELKKLMDEQFCCHEGRLLIDGLFLHIMGGLSVKSVFFRGEYVTQHDISHPA